MTIKKQSDTYTSTEAAEKLGMSAGGLRAMSARGDGPPFRRPGARYQYPVAEFNQYLKQTSHPGGLAAGNREVMS